ncbi:MAG: outer membrane lipoprotein LolB [Spongiibacteraceae bacterium]|nr:outer membrane lipoprotein LolB [Spongiibacteraceae bacterium]
MKIQPQQKILSPLKTMNTHTSSQRGSQTLCALTLLSMLLLQACSLLAPAPKTPLTEMKENSQIKQWQLKGKIGLRQNSQAHSAYLNWQQCGDHFDIRLSGPFGQGAAHIVGDSQGVTLTRADQTSMHAQTAQQLLSQELGWSIPVLQLVYWIRGLPEPSKPFVESIEETGFSQSTWQVSYPRLRVVENHTLPAKAIATQPSLKVTLILKSWNLHPACESIQ